VVPIDHNPTELAWFDHLKTKYDFPLLWGGKTWVDSTMADDPSVPRYFLANGSEEVISKELRDEQAAAAAVGSVADAIERIQAVTKRLADIDPFYRYEIRTSPEGTTVIPHEAYLGAAQDRPIRISLQGRFPDTPEGREKLEEFVSAVSFGTPATLEPEFLLSVVVDAPIPTGVPRTGVTAIFGGVEDLWTERAAFRVISPEGRALATLPVQLGGRTRGTQGGIRNATDYSGALSIRIRIDVLNQQGSATVRYSPPDDALPASVLPALHLIDLIQPLNTLVLYFEGRATSSTFALDGLPEPPVPHGYVRIVEALARIQTATRTAFPIPMSFSEWDMVANYRSDCLLRGEKVAVTWASFTFKGTVTEDLKQAFRDPPRLMAIAETEHIEHICGVEISLGPARLVMLSARIEDRDGVLAEVRTLGEEIQLTVAPGANDDGEWVLLPSVPT
jgi:hypothetical protein